MLTLSSAFTAKLLNCVEKDLWSSPAQVNALETGILINNANVSKIYSTLLSIDCKFFCQLGLLWCEFAAMCVNDTVSCVTIFVHAYNHMFNQLDQKSDAFCFFFISLWQSFADYCTNYPWSDSHPCIMHLLLLLLQKGFQT